MLLFLDTETTGYLNSAKDLHHPDQPHLVQFAAILCDIDGTERASFSAIVRPAGWEIPMESMKIHGITNALAKRAGLPITNILDIWERFSHLATCIIGHNVGFDITVMNIQALRYNRIPLPNDLDYLTLFDTCREAAPILMLPPTPAQQEVGIRGPKLPTLSECYERFFNEPLEGAHDALADVRACKRVYFEILKQQDLPIRRSKGKDNG